MVQGGYTQEDAEVELKAYFDTLRLTIVNFDCVEKEVYDRVVAIIEKITPVVL